MRKYRIKIVDRNSNTMYLTVYDGNIVLQAATGMPFALSNIAGKNAMPLAFALEDANHVYEALDAVRRLAPSVDAEAYEETVPIEDQGILVVADFPNAGRQLWRGGLFDDEADAVSEFNSYVELNFNPQEEKPKFVSLMTVVLRK